MKDQDMREPIENAVAGSNGAETTAVNRNSTRQNSAFTQERNTSQMALTIDLVKLFRYYLKRIWLLILCAIIGFGGMYCKAQYMTPDTYTASATMYVYNANPNIVIAGGVLFLLFILNRRVTDSKELTENYSLPLLANNPKQHTMESQSDYLLNKKTSSQVLAAYGKLRMNLFFTLQGTTKVIIVSSAIPGENKSTVSANLAISFAIDGKHVLLIDGDMRKPSQYKLFKMNEKDAGLSNLLVPGSDPEDVIHREIRENLDLLLAGTVPPNPSELLNSPTMRSLLEKYKKEYDLIVLDTPPINVVSDALVLSDSDVGMLFLARCDYSDHREIRRALNAAEFTGINMLGMAMTCAVRSGDSYYGYRYYKHYYGSYDRYLSDASKDKSKSSGKKKKHHKMKKHHSHTYF